MTRFWDVKAELVERTELALFASSRTELASSRCKRNLPRRRATKFESLTHQRRARQMVIVLYVI